MSKKTAKQTFKSKIRRIPEFKGVVFWDITPMLKDKLCFRQCIKQLADHYKDKNRRCRFKSSQRIHYRGSVSLRARRRVCSYTEKRKVTIQMRRLNLQERVRMRYNRDT